ncbi:hypothetical protein FACS189472_18130 [Alphaproteobacteria bacterium]|nr:hypothetical protein FACS189472_18130 [Alphaproteobacteria bacterium]
MHTHTQTHAHIVTNTNTHTSTQTNTEKHTYTDTQASLFSITHVFVCAKQRIITQNQSKETMIEKQKRMHTYKKKNLM